MLPAVACQARLSFRWLPGSKCGSPFLVDLCSAKSFQSRSFLLLGTRAFGAMRMPTISLRGLGLFFRGMPEPFACYGCFFVRFIFPGLLLPTPGHSNTKECLRLVLVVRFFLFCVLFRRLTFSTFVMVQLYDVFELQWTQPPPPVSRCLFVCEGSSFLVLSFCFFPQYSGFYLISRLFFFPLPRLTLPRVGHSFVWWWSLLYPEQPSLRCSLITVCDTWEVTPPRNLFLMSLSPVFSSPISGSPALLCMTRSFFF